MTSTTKRLLNLTENRSCYECAVTFDKGGVEVVVERSIRLVRSMQDNSEIKISRSVLVFWHSIPARRGFKDQLTIAHDYSFPIDIFSFPCSFSNPSFLVFAHFLFPRSVFSDGMVLARADVAPEFRKNWAMRSTLGIHAWSL